MITPRAVNACRNCWEGWWVGLGELGVLGWCAGLGWVSLVCWVVLQVGTLGARVGVSWRRGLVRLGWPGLDVTGWQQLVGVTWLACGLGASVRSRIVRVCDSSELWIKCKCSRFVSVSLMVAEQARARAECRSWQLLCGWTARKHLQVPGHAWCWRLWRSRQELRGDAMWSCVSKAR